MARALCTSRFGCGCATETRLQTLFSAAALSSTVGCTRSWDNPDPPFFRVIIDNMMNLCIVCMDWQQHTSGHCGIACRQNKYCEAERNPDRRFMRWGTMRRLERCSGELQRRGIVTTVPARSRGQVWSIHGFVNSKSGPVIMG